MKLQSFQSHWGFSHLSLFPSFILSHSLALSPTHTPLLLFPLSRLLSVCLPLSLSHISLPASLSLSLSFLRLANRIKALLDSNFEMFYFQLLCVLLIFKPLALLLFFPPPSLPPSLSALLYPSPLPLLSVVGSGGLWSPAWLDGRVCSALPLHVSGCGFSESVSECPAGELPPAPVPPPQDAR